MMKILVVDLLPSRRAELVDWTCELPGYVVVDAASGLAQTEALLASAHVDVIVLGTVPSWDKSSIARAAMRHGCVIIEATGTMDELAAELATHRANRRELTMRAAQFMRLDYVREAQHASLQTLQYRMRTESRAEPAETIDLREWLPLTIARLRGVVPAHIELVPMVAVDTLPVRCVAKVLEDVVSETVLRACAHLPWGGTVWLTAAPGEAGEVTLDVLEDGRGEIRDVRLRASAPVCS